MRYPDYIFKVLGTVAILMAASACVKSDIEYETNGGEISIAPVTSVVAKSVPGPVAGSDYPQLETMGIIAFHNQSSGAGPWEDDNASLYIDKGEFGFVEQYSAWGGVTSRFVDNEKVTERNPYEWPSQGSLIFAGFSPYYRFEHTHPNQMICLKDYVSFDLPSRTLSLNYTVGQYVPMTSEQMENNDEYVNISQSDLMFFMPQVADGKYIGVNRVNIYPAHFQHALSLVEFTVRAEDAATEGRLDIDRITLEEVYHTGKFTATVNDDGTVTAGWSALEGQEDVNIFGDDDAASSGLHLDMAPRTVAQLLILPGSTHRIKVVCHVYIQGKMYEQTYIIRPEEVGISNWEMGKRYVYNLVLGLNKITFSPEAYEWDNSYGGGIASHQTNDNQ